MDTSGSPEARASSRTPFGNYVAPQSVQEPHQPQEPQEPQQPQENQQPQEPQDAQEPQEPQPEIEVISPWLPEPHHINHMPLRRLCADINDEIIEAMFCQGGLDIVEAAKENSRNNDQQVNKGMWEYFIGKYQEKIKEQLPAVIEAMENMVIRLDELARVDDAQVVGAVGDDKEPEKKKDGKEDSDEEEGQEAGDQKVEDGEEDKDQAMDYYHEHNEDDSAGEEELVHLWDVQEEDEGEDDVDQYGDIQESTV